MMASSQRRLVLASEAIFKLPAHTRSNTAEGSRGAVYSKDVRVMPDVSIKYFGFSFFSRPW